MILLIIYNIFLVGDTPLDIRAGKEAKVITIGVATGIFSKEDLEKAGADFVLDSLENIEDFLRIVLIEVIWTGTLISEIIGQFLFLLKLS